jgi:hypothetical protein
MAFELKWQDKIDDINILTEFKNTLILSKHLPRILFLLAYFYY